MRGLGGRGERLGSGCPNLSLQQVQGAQSDSSPGDQGGKEELHSHYSQSGREDRIQVGNPTPTGHYHYNLFSQGQEKAKEVQEITWSTNKDRLI